MKDLLYRVIMESQSLGWVGVSLPEKISSEILEWVKQNIPKEIIKEEEKNPHITLKYGIHTFDPKRVENAISDYSEKGRKEIRGMCGQINIFEHPDQEVLVLKVVSVDIEKLNHLLCCRLETTDTYKEYKPHITLAYVKKGTGGHYAGNRDFFGKKFTINEIEFNDANKRNTKIKL